MEERLIMLNYHKKEGKKISLDMINLQNPKEEETDTMNLKDWIGQFLWSGI